MAIENPPVPPGGSGSNGRVPVGAGLNNQIKKQINLPWAKAIQIAINSLKIRFWRSVITASGIFLSIAFLCYSGTPILIKILKFHTLPSDADSNRQVWLVIMALLVCTVGIMNAMLMSVSERFREIGTMKCLGALDSLIVRLFIIEAVFMGMISSVGGWLLGFLALLLMQGTEGINGSVTLWSFISSVVIGAVLTLLAALLPALRAAQMPPAAALRTTV
ncbi:MAG: FtsX-like permease family protein [Armatimonadota bacterium]|nr:FtsX-like permease family protein [Armatimonadota bacterium]